MGGREGGEGGRKRREGGREGAQEGGRGGRGVRKGGGKEERGWSMRVKTHPSHPLSPFVPIGL